MKKMRLLMICSFVAFGSTAQNLDLNNWAAADDATGWSALLNPYEAFVGDTSVVKDNGSVGFGARLTPVDLSGLIGQAVYASIFDLGTTGTGIPQAVRLDSVYFDGKINMAGATVQAGVQVSVTKFNGSTVDTIGYGEYIFNSDVNNFTTYGIKIDYLPAFNGIQPDSVKIEVVIGSADAGATSAALWVDQFRLVEIDYTGIAENTPTEATVYPNPAHDDLNISTEDEIASVILTSLDGKIVARANNKSVNVANLNAGMYMYTVTTVNGKVAAGSFAKN